MKTSIEIQKDLDDLEYKRTMREEAAQKFSHHRQLQERTRSMKKKEPELTEKQEIICGDCLEVMKGFADKSFDLVLTDPPYGVNYEYNQYQDTPENLKALVDSFMPEVLRISKRVMITCGNGNQYLYPKPDWTLAWVITAGAGQNKWGFTCWQPILVYGKDPYRENSMGARPDIIQSNETSDDFGHSCTKPINLWKSILARGSVKESDTILDPFLGSGTTLVAAKQLNRNAVGIEISPEYCEIARRRLEQQTLL